MGVGIYLFLVPFILSVFGWSVSEGLFTGYFAFGFALILMGLLGVRLEGMEWLGLSDKTISVSVDKKFQITLKWFIRLKIGELTPIACALSVYLIASSIIFIGLAIVNPEEFAAKPVGAIVTSLILGLLVCLFGLVIGDPLSRWLSHNWKKATSLADLELVKKPKRKKRVIG